MLPSYVLATSRVEEIHSKSHTNFVSSSKHWLLLYISSKSEFHINILWSSPLYRKKCQNVIYIWDSMNALVNILRPDFLRQTNFCSNDSRWWQTPLNYALSLEKVLMKHRCGYSAILQLFRQNIQPLIEFHPPVNSKKSIIWYVHIIFNFKRNFSYIPIETVNMWWDIHPESIVWCPSSERSVFIVSPE